MMVENEWIAGGVSSFDDRLVVCQGLVANHCYTVFRQCLKESQVVPGCITQYHQEKDSVLPQYNFQDFPDLQHVGTDDLGDHKETTPVGCASDQHLLGELVTRLHHGAEPRNVIGCRWGDFSEEEEHRLAEQTDEAPEKLGIFQLNL